MKESLRSFRARVHAATGCELAQIPEGVELDALGPIICRRGSLYVVVADQAYIDPSEPTGDPENYRTVNLGE